MGWVGIAVRLRVDKDRAEYEEFIGNARFHFLRNCLASPDGGNFILTEPGVSLEIVIQLSARLGTAEHGGTTNQRGQHGNPHNISHHFDLHKSFVYCDASPQTTSDPALLPHHAKLLRTQNTSA